MGRRQPDHVLRHVVQAGEEPLKDLRTLMRTIGQGGRAATAAHWATSDHGCDRKGGGAQLLECSGP
ncbi:hypothetical protein [Streptomyces sp. 4N124]|uniref:hypothetical protein n=1 Tax=Streptomyces sp. 4N124 TaxID=3457420 RepID=UPI003FD452CB